MTNLDVSKRIRLHEALSTALISIRLREIDFETMFFLYAKVSKTHKDETVYDLNMYELQELTGKQYNRKEYIQSVKRLRSITFEIDEGESVLIDGILSNARYIEGKGTMRVKISSEMKPYLLELTQDYTEHQLYSMLKIKSKHAKKLYMYFCKHRPKNGVVRSVIDFQTIESFKRELGFIDPDTGEELHVKWSNFKNRVLDVAKDEINLVSNLKVAYNVKKYGRETNWIEWIIENKNNDALIKLEPFTQLALSEKNKSENFIENIDELAFIERLKDEYKLSPEQARKVARMVDRKMLLDVLKRVNDADKKDPIDPKRLGGYTLKAINRQFGTSIE